MLDDRAARFGLPFPHAFQKFVAAQDQPARLLALHQLPLDNHLRGDAGMVRAWLPKHILAAHPLEAAENVLQGGVERMAHMQGAGDVRRRNDDRERCRAPPARVARPGKRPLFPMPKRYGLRPLQDRKSFPSLDRRSGVARASGGPAGAGRVKWERWQTSGQKASARGPSGISAAANLGKATAPAPRFLLPARDPIDFGSDKAFHDARQIVIEPALEHGTQHFTGKTNDGVAVLDKPAGEKCVEGGAR